MSGDELVTPLMAYLILLEVWYVTVPTALLGVWGVATSRVRAPETSLRPLVGLLLWPCSLLLLGVGAALIDSDPLLLPEMLLLVVLLIGGMVHLAAIARRTSAPRWGINGLAPLFLWVHLVTTFASFVGVSGFFRNWR